ncbi:MAG: hypothetical protein U9O53_00465 [archaeon]|nr:hypothetical protein [archaeon]
MCAIIGGLWLKEKIDGGSYSGIYTNPLDYEIFIQLLRSSGNRGHESVGAYLEGSNQLLCNLRSLGTVSDFISDHESKIKKFLDASDLQAFLGHVRYATSSGDKREGKGSDRNNIHPLSVVSKNYQLRILENGQTCFNESFHELTDEDIGDVDGFALNRYGATSDTSVKGMKMLECIELLSLEEPGSDFNHLLYKCLDKVYEDTFDNGMFSTLGIIKDKRTDESRFFVMRDGGRPLFYFDLNGYRIFTSESSPASDLKQKTSFGLVPKNIHKFPPGTFQVYDASTGSLICTGSNEKTKPDCFFEYQYLMAANARTYDINSNRVNIGDLRAAMGVQTFREHPDILGLSQDDDDCIICPAPHSADLFSRDLDSIGLNVSYDKILRNHTLRTFIATDDPEERARRADDKFTVSPDVEGRKVIVFDDSLVRYTVAAVLNKKLRSMGAVEVYYMFGCPPITSPCYGGINTYRKDLAVTIIEAKHGISASEIGDDYYGTGAHADFEKALEYFEHDGALGKYFGGPVKTDGIGFLSIAGLNKVMDSFNLPPTAQCCVTGKYPYRFNGIRDGQFIPSAEYTQAIKSKVIA